MRSLSIGPSFALAALATLLVVPGETHASVCGTRLFSVSPSNPLLSEHEPLEGYLLLEQPMFLPGGTVISAHGLAADWDSEQLYALLDIAGTPGSFLALVDPDSAVVTPIGATGMTFASLAIAPGGTILAVTGDGAAAPESLYTLDPLDGTPSFLCTLGSGDDGEAIAFSWYDLQLLHASGTGGPYDPVTDTGVIFEQLDPFGPSGCATTALDLDPALTAESCTALTFRGDGFLSWKAGTAPGPLYLVEPWSGAIVHTGWTPVAISALAALPLCSANQFVRGDVNADGAVNIGDPIAILGLLFAAGSVSCEIAADVNGDLLHNIADPIHLLGTLFTPGAPSPAAPYPDCGWDPSQSPFDCAASPCP